MKIPFDQAVKEGQTFVISPGCKTENIGIFSDLRVDRETIPSDWYAYDIRHTDNGSFGTIENHVLVNHLGTFLTKKPIDLGTKGYKNLNGRGGYSFGQF